MAILKKPEDIVTRIMNRLKKAKEVAVERETHDLKQIQLESKFQLIEKDIRTMDGLLPKVKSIEKDLTEHLMRLEGEIDDDIFKHPGKFDEIIHKLERVSNSIESVKAFTSSAKLELPKATDDTSDEQHKPSTSKVQCIMEPEDWEVVLTADNIFGTRVNHPRSMGTLGEIDGFCLLSLSIFPDNCSIKKRPITYWWLTDAFHQYNSAESAAEEVGDRILQGLKDRRLISANKPHSMDNFTVHTGMRTVLTAEAMLRGLFKFDTKGRPEDDERQAFLFSDPHVHNGNRISPETLLRVINSDQSYLSFKADWLSKLKKVVALQLGRWQSSPEHHIEIENEESLEGLGALKHLRYLSLRGISRIFTLPRSVTQLFSLEILDLQACHNFEKLPSNISSTRNLTHLDISECYLLESMPSGFEKLSKLQVLKGFLVGIKGKASSKISDLARLKKLRKLGIRIAANPQFEEGEFDDLKDISSLRNLTISRGTTSSSPNPQNTMSPLSLPTSLKKLGLRYIPEETLPVWIDLHKLKDLEKLCIRGGQLKELKICRVRQVAHQNLTFKVFEGLDN